MPSTHNNNLPSHACAFGVAINAAGEVVEIKQGEFNSQQAEQIASRLVLLAARIRNAVVSAEADFLITRD